MYILHLALKTSQCLTQKLLHSYFTCCHLLPDCLKIKFLLGGGPDLIHSNYFFQKKKVTLALLTNSHRISAYIYSKLCRIMYMMCLMMSFVTHWYYHLFFFFSMCNSSFLHSFTPNNDFISKASQCLLRINLLLTTTNNNNNHDD